VFKNLFNVWIYKGESVELKTIPNTSCGLYTNRHITWA